MPRSGHASLTSGPVPAAYRGQLRTFKAKLAAPATAIENLLRATALSWPMTVTRRGPYRINQRSANHASTLFGPFAPGCFAEFFDDAVVLELGKMIDKEHAVDVVDLVLAGHRRLLLRFYFGSATSLFLAISY